MSPSAPASSEQTKTHAALLRRWPGFDAIATDLAIPYYTVTAWHHRNSVPERYWSALSQSAKHRGIRGPTYAAFRACAAQHRLAPSCDASPTAQPPIRSRTIKAESCAAQDAQPLNSRQLDSMRKNPNAGN
jgi:hypothetical protein